MGLTVLVVEDEQPIREMLRMVFQAEGMQMLEAGTSEHALNLLTQLAEAGGKLPDVLVLDWMLPGASGLELARRLRKMEATSHLPILFLTARGDEDDKVRGLEMGADDYMVKPFSPRELVARLRALVRRSGALADDDTWVVGAIRLDKATHRVSVGGTEVTMGPTEFNLLQFLIQNPDRVFSRDQLLDAVWGRHVVLDERTVDVHIRRLRKALAPTGADGQVQTVRGAGYRLSRGA